MVWFVLFHLFSCLVDLFTVRQLTDTQKDIRILLLRQQVHVLQRKVRQPKRFSRLEKTLLAVLVAKLKRTTSDFRAQVQPLLLFSPDTVLRWHRELIRRKWTLRRKVAAGHSRTRHELHNIPLTHWSIGKRLDEIRTIKCNGSEYLIVMPENKQKRTSKKPVFV